MKTFLSLMAIPLVALAVAAGPAAPTAHASAYGYAQTTIENPTGQTLYYAVQWGDGEWVNYALHANEYRTHYHAYGPDGRHSPQLRIKFDYTMLDDDYIGKQYDLVRYANHSVDRYASKRYTFRLSGGYLDLYGMN